MNSKDIIRYITLWDKILIVLLSVLTIGSFYFIKVLLPTGAEASIEVEGKNIGSYSLKENRIIKIKGHLGHAEIEIKDGKIRMIKAPCPDKTCMKQGWVSRSGDALICLPNQVMVYVSGESQYDAISW